MIGHSAGANLIDTVATELLAKSIETGHKPFIHLTFLHAYTPPLKSDQFTYGASANYAEHYVDRSVRAFPPWCIFFVGPTSAILKHALIFNITKWKSNDPLKEKIPLCGHEWPRYWYQKSVTSGGFRYGYPLSREGGSSEYKTLAKKKYKAKQCRLRKKEDECVPK